MWNIRSVSDERNDRLLRSPPFAVTRQVSLTSLKLYSLNSQIATCTHHEASFQRVIFGNPNWPFCPTSSKARLHQTLVLLQA